MGKVERVYLNHIYPQKDWGKERADVKRQLRKIHLTHGEILKISLRYAENSLFMPLLRSLTCGSL